VGGSDKRRKSFEPLLMESPKAPACFCFRCPLGKTYPECSLACAEELDRIIERQGADTVAAFIAEPVVGSTIGAVVPPDDYWPRIAEICRKHGVLLSADEVMTGFGRTGKRFAVEHWGVTPDIITGGKGLAGGYAPIGGVYTTDRVVEPIAATGDELMFFTFGAHPAACAAADRVLEILEREGLIERAVNQGQYLQKRLEEKLSAHPNVAQVRGLGLLRAVELVRDRETMEPFPAEARLIMRVVASGLINGAFFYPGGDGPAPDAVLLGPPFVVTDDEIDAIVDILGKSIDEAVAKAAR
jgi:adenosylmethionine-8-amino-7-oxononanoate aminotransferase